MLDDVKSFICRLCRFNGLVLGFISSMPLRNKYREMTNLNSLLPR